MPMATCTTRRRTKIFADRGSSETEGEAVACLVYTDDESHLFALLALRATTTVLADSRPTALLALRALTSVLAHLRPTALLALFALTTVLAD